jgi:predicted amidohydrolase YtcJ
MKSNFFVKINKFSWIFPFIIFLLIGINVAISQSTKNFNLQNPVIYHNGAIFTLEKDKTGKEIIEQALRTENGKITHLGTNEKILKLKNNHTSLVDLNGKSIFPAFVETQIEKEMIMKQVLAEMEEIKKQGYWAKSHERLNLFLEAFRNLTIKQAILNKTENQQGTLLPEKFANLIILDKNPLLFNPAKYNEIEVYATVFVGKFSVK